MGCLGGNSASKTQNEQIEKTFEYDNKVYDFNWATQADVDKSLADGDATNDLKLGQKWEQLKYQSDGLQIARNNNKEIVDLQNENLRRNWEYGKSVQDYQYQQLIKGYNKSQQVYGKQLAFNEKEMEFALEREDQVLDEQFLEAAFQNQGLIQDLYEATGQAGYDKAALQLGISDVHGQLGYQQTKVLRGLEDNLKDSEFKAADVQVDLIDKYGKGDFSKAMLTQDLKAKEGINKYDKFELGIDVHSAKTKADFENEILRREISDQKAKTAFATTEANVKALQASGEAQLSQAGRSQGKAIQQVIAQLGRQSAYTVETLVRGSKIADARAKQNNYNATNTEAKAVVASDKIDLSTLDNIATARLQINEVDRDLGVSGEKAGLDLDKIRTQILGQMENANIDVKEIDRNLKSNITDAGLNMRKVDWDLANTGSRFKQNQGKLKANLDSAVKASISSRKDIAISKLAADLSADAKRMIEPTRAPEQEQPLNIKYTQYQDPMTPSVPPRPIKGAKAETNSLGNAIGSIASGVAVGSSIAGMSFAGAGPIGLAIGIGTALFG